MFTVESILEAAAYVLIREGWDRFTTNRVADRAGVNIASLYQYFPNKESIVAELQRRHVERARREFAQAMPVLRAQRSLRALLRVMVAAGVAEHRSAPALHRVFAEELPRSSRPRMVGHEEEWLVESQLLAKRFMKNVPDPDLAMFLCQLVVHAAIHETATMRPELLDHPLFVDEIVAMLDGYLRRSR